MGGGFRPDGPVWKIANAEGAMVMTPEHVQEAIDAGASRDEVWRDVLIGIEARCVEDASLAAFVALRMEKS